jgi:hypothetical protein
VRRSFRVDLDEVSALCLRRRQGAPSQLLAIGDEAYDIVAAELAGDELVKGRTQSVGGLIDTGEGSEWEGIASDGAVSRQGGSPRCAGLLAQPRGSTL